MKRILQSAVLLSVIIIGLFAFRVAQNSGIKGTVSPAEGTGMVWAISSSDSLKMTPEKGTFAFSLKPGTYKVIVQAVSDYKSFIKENVVVEDGKVTDLGTITLEKIILLLRKA
ncbi:carboxypeptidase-like regulatory domain-containing protein [Flavitalea sp.]|nr:carboxypeptidase-like regulatory domain-containing protein [Flavitalea sp.]